ncbi:hypothetical protein EV188_104407 [Actinomycetospora succinea]|uniref:Uncharacterized protein n=1 Tax=Actinomycetospora succinea TaxID=663603 RepID=A0A4R6VE18_9PSEU|nr:hypothetical protein [Actinomycetospora succinea]TDQ58660.1 hypothetical protein EV188_104407 [Actinomycetospora succinea]
MAEDQKDKKPPEDPVATALTAPDAPINDNGSVPPAGPPERVARPAAPAPSRGVTDSVVEVASDAAGVVRRVLPHRTPVYLGGAALLVLGVVDLPVAAGGALVYEAIRRWHPAR